MHVRRLACSASLVSALVLSSPASGAAQTGVDFFEARVRPVLTEKCADCHVRVRRGGLRIHNRAALLEGGRSGPAIVPGNPDASLLVQVVRHEIPDLEMPEDAPALSPREIEALAEWIRMDAPWPEEAPDVVYLAAAETGMSPSARLFVDRVQPVLTQKCAACHIDEERGGLRMDSRAHLLDGGGRGPALVPGNPERSLLVQAIRHEHPDLRMPRNAEKLTDGEIQGIVDWIRSGAEWSEATAPLAVPRRGATAEERAFWSFQPLAAVTVPSPPPGNDGWGKTAIDRFVMAKHEEMGVRPVAFADPRTLIRRATFDLTGLPPTPAEVEAFVADTAADAFARVVDRLLASPHYGERWGRHWLDVTRFGEDDTRGLAEDGSGRERYPNAYVHRDWVVDAFNRDMPYDRFVLGHLAADLLPDEADRKELLPGLGFLGQGPWYYDLADPPVARADERHDRVDVTSRAFLGLTVGCARCHDHKYDPIGTHDYYAMAGIFNNTNYHEYPRAEADEAARFERERTFIEDLDEGLGEYLSTESDQLARVLALQSSDYLMAAWKVTGKERIPAERAAGEARLDLETLQRWIDFLDDEPKHYPFLVPWQEMMADGGGTEERATELADSLQRLILEVVAEQKKLEERNEKIIAKGTPLEEVKSTPMPNGFESFFDEHQLELESMDRERFNFYADVFLYDLDNELDTFFPKPALLRFRGWSLERQLSRVAADHVAATREEIDERKKDLPDIPVVMGVEDKDSTGLGDIALHIRGSPLNLGEAVPRGFPLVLDAPEAEPYTDGSGRLQLARDVVAHPLTDRVMANRVWAWHMGEGIVRTPSNFGFAGQPPTHPELLEYLAGRFVESGRSVKALHREIMTSSVYQLAAVDEPAYADIDPDNRWLWRFRRQRLDAEGIRDALLAVSGSLDPEVGGPSLQLDDSTNVRRTLYSEVSRFQVHEYLQTFDFPNPSLSAERRFSTNVPVQSLYFLNSPFVERRARDLVRRLAREAVRQVADDDGGSAAVHDRGGADPALRGDGGAVRPRAPERPPQEAPDTAADGLPERFDDRAMIEAAYPLLYARPATEREVELGLEFLDRQRAAHGAATGTEASTPAEGTPPPAEHDAASPSDPDLAARRASMEAWVQYARALFAASEFRYIG